MNSQIDYEMEQSRKLLLPKLFRVWKTLNKMLEDRGYVVEDYYSEITYQEWLEKNNNKASLNGIFYKKLGEERRLQVIDAMKKYGYIE